MKLVSLSAHSGAGKHGTLFSFLLFSWPLSSVAVADSGEWIESSSWPYSHTIDGEGHYPLLVVLEQAGVDLRVRLPNGTVSNSPVGRMGPEFIYLAPGETAEVSLEPVFAATGAGRFRFTHVELEDDSHRRLGRILSQAGEHFGSDSENLRIQACREYREVSEISGLNSDWLDLAHLLSGSCYLATGQEISEVLLESLNEETAFLSVLPYHTNWLKGEYLYIARSFARADVEFEIALRKAKHALAEYPDRALGIRHDVAEIQSMLGGNAFMLAFILGGDEASEGSAERRRLLDESERNLNAAIVAAQELDNAYVLGRAYDLRAGMHFVREENLQVIDDLMLAKEQMEKTGNPDRLLPILGSIGDFHKRWGELRPAQEAYLESLRIIDGNTTNGKYADVYHNIGTFYYDLGDFDRARDYVETSIRLSRATGRETRAYTNSIQLALILEEENDYESAKALNQELLDHFTRMDIQGNARFWSPYRIMTQSALSRIEYELGNVESALKLSAKVIAQIESRAINVATDLPPIYINHANILFAADHKGAALETLDGTIQKYLNEPIEMVDLLAAKMSLLQRLQRTEEAITVANEVFDIIESQRVEFDTVRLGPYWSGRTNDIYTSHIDYLLQIESDQSTYQALAFEVTERARATSLRLRRQEMLLAKNETNSEARAQWIDIISEIQRHQGRLQTQQDNVDFERRISEARERYFASHGIALSIEGLEIQSIEEIRARLSDDLALIQFVAGPDKEWRFDISADGWSVKEIGDTSHVEATIDAALSELSNAYIRDRQNTIALSELLLSGLALNSSVNNLLVSPSHSLNAFPFAALLMNGEFISDAATITVVPSLSEYFTAGPQSIDGPKETRLEIAVLADPAFGALVPAPFLGDRESFPAWAASLQRLPASALEARELSRFYAEDSRLILLGSQATQRSFFDSKVRNAKVIHIATHGYFDESTPELIGFAMAKDNEDDDGFVSMAEISAQDFSADLVVISACNTGRGFEIPGEGNMSLARTFLAQGVDSVVSTLWPVSDSATALFMREFYRSLNEDKLSLAESLQSAQKTLRDTGRYRHPFYWSGYTLTTAESPLETRL